jgi:RNA polymerase sigma-70 factor (ECF subfamily)
VRREALTRFLRRYNEALKTHLVYRKRIDQHQAEDVVQGFLLSRVIEADLIKKADANRGRFRSYLLTSLDRYASNELRGARAKKRGGGERVDLDEAAHAEDSTAAPLQKFEVAWAQQVLRETVKRMRDHCERTGRQELWGLFEARVLAPTLEHADPVPYEQLMERYRLESQEQAANLLVTAKRTFTRAMRSVIAEYEQDDGAIDAEIADLRKILMGG